MITGKNGSGTIFFSGCNLRCIYCQNHVISDGSTGCELDENRLIDIMFELRDSGAHNINLVTPSHYIHLLPSTLYKAKAAGLDIPIIYNTSAYEDVSKLKELSGLVDVYLPDYKYHRSEPAAKYSSAPDYPEVARRAIDEMFRQQSHCTFTTHNNICLITNGVIVRHMVLPLATGNSMDAIEYLYNHYKDDIYISIMSQYTPVNDSLPYPELRRKVTGREYNKVVEYSLSLGITNAYIQEGKVAESSFIPDFCDYPELSRSPYHDSI